MVLVTFRTDDKCTESKMGLSDRDGQPKESVSSREHQGQWTKPRQSTVKSNKYRRGQIGPSCNQSLVRYTHTLYVSVCQEQVNINTGQSTIVFRDDCDNGGHSLYVNFKSIFFFYCTKFHRIGCTIFAISMYFQFSTSSRAIY